MSEKSEEETNYGKGDVTQKKGAIRRGLIALFFFFALALVTTELTKVTNFYAQVISWAENLLHPKQDFLTIVGVRQQGGDDTSFVNGLRMAVDEINANEEGILGQRVRLELIQEERVGDDTALEDVVQMSLQLAEKAVKRPNLLAVVGHEATDTAVPASSVYGRSDVLFLATQATGRAVTDRGFKTVFALQPQNSTSAQMIAHYAMGRKSRRFLVLTDNSDYARESANFFTAAVTKNQGQIVFRGHLGNAQRSTDELLLFILDNKLFKISDFDAFFIVSSSNTATTEFIKNARKLGLNQPIYGMEYLFSEAIEAAVGKEAMRDVTGVSLYNRDSASERGSEFFGKYKEKYGRTPDLQSAIGFDALILIRDAATRAGSIGSKGIADTLKISRYQEPFSGVTGRLIFNEKGQITDTHVFVVTHDGNDFSTVARYKIPILWDNSSGAKGDIPGGAGTGARSNASMDKGTISQ